MIVIRYSIVLRLESHPITNLRHNRLISPNGLERLIASDFSAREDFFLKNTTSRNKRKRHVAEVAAVAESVPPFRHKRHFRYSAYSRKGH